MHNCEIEIQVKCTQCQHIHTVPIKNPGLSTFPICSAWVAQRLPAKCDNCEVELTYDGSGVGGRYTK